MAENIVTCVTCPIGCSITVESDGKDIKSIEGAQCKRGVEYAKNEVIAPVRILTSIVKVDGAAVPLVAVRSNRPVPKESMFQCMDEIRKVVMPVPVHVGDVIVADICGTGCDIVATGCAD